MRNAVREVVFFITWTAFWFGLGGMTIPDALVPFHFDVGSLMVGAGLGWVIRTMIEP